MKWGKGIMWYRLPGINKCHGDVLYSMGIIVNNIRPILKLLRKKMLKILVSKKL